MKDPGRWRRIKEIFSHALRLEALERAEYLQRVCGGDASLRREVEELLRSHGESNAFLELPESAAPEGGAFLTNLVGVRIGHCRLVEVISSGGMGTVYKAVQEDLDRSVAVKVMRPSLFSPQSIRRFEFEARVLGRLTHAHIAQIVETGTFQHDGMELPYFVMEYVEGARFLTEYARKEGLTIRERLELFLQVCDGVQHGHRKGVIHRDLKPANLLVDREGQVKIIDFGVARATDADLALTTCRTEVGQLLGTLQYMSPEQCLADPGELDTRSDVYALGVVLYELLCDTLPYDVGKAPVFEATRIIREQEPRRPSTINGALRGDLETILLKTLSKDRERRYSTVGALREDLRRYLEGDVILARPTGPVTRMLLRIRKNPVISGAAGVVFLLTAAFAGYILFVSYPRLKEESENTKRINQFLEDALSSSDPYSRDGKADVVDILDQASRRIDTEFPRKPAIEASLRMTLGVTYLNHGRYESAREQFEKSLAIRRRLFGEEGEETVTVENWLGAALRSMGELEAAETLLERSFEKGLRCFGKEHSVTIQAMTYLALVYQNQGRLEEAEPLLQRVLELDLRILGKEHRYTLMAMNNLALVLQEKGVLDEAERLDREVIRIQAGLFGEDHPQVLDTMNNLALVLQQQGKKEEAEALFRKALAGQERILGREHPHTLNPLHNLGILMAQEGKFQEAESVYREVVEIRTRVLGPEHPDTLLAMDNLASVLRKQGEFEESLALSRKALETEIRVLGREHPNTLRSMYNLAVGLKKAGRLEEAERLYRETLVLHIRVHGEGAVQTLQVVNNLGYLLKQQGKVEEAETRLAGGVTAARASLGEKNTLRAFLLMNHGDCLVKLKRYGEAESELLEGHTILESAVGGEHAWTRLAVEALTGLYEAWGKEDEAARWRARIE